MMPAAPPLLHARCTACWIVTGIAASTRQPIDCILAHAGTNLALGVWVIATGAWWLM